MQQLIASEITQLPQDHYIQYIADNQTYQIDLTLYDTEPGPNGLLKRFLQKTKKIAPRLTNASFQPNYKDCYCQFGVLDEQTVQHSEQQVKYDRKPHQLLWIQETNEFIISYNDEKLNNAIIFGEVANPESLNELKEAATIDGRCTLSIHDTQ